MISQILMRVIVSYNGKLIVLWYDWLIGKTLFDFIVKVPKAAT